MTAKILETAMGITVSDELLAKLKDIFPDSVRTLRNEAEMHYRRGQQNVIEYLEHLKRDTENSIYNIKEDTS